MTKLNCFSRHLAGKLLGPNSLPIMTQHYPNQSASNLVDDSRIPP